jgi:hypothetical protein
VRNLTMPFTIRYAVHSPSTVRFPAFIVTCRILYFIEDEDPIRNFQSVAHQGNYLRGFCGCMDGQFKGDILYCDTRELR